MSGSNGNGRSNGNGKLGVTLWDTDADLREAILTVVRNGGTFREAVEAAGIGRSTFMEWKAKRADILDALTHARKEGRARRLALIDLHAERDWRAAAWLLAVENPYRYSVKQRVEHSTPERPMGEELTDAEKLEALDRLGEALDTKSPQQIASSHSRLPE